MAMNSSNVSAAKPRAAGCVYYAAAGTVEPTDASSALAATYTNVGYISEDGITRSETRSVTQHKAFGGTIVDVSQEEYGETYAFTMLETSQEVLAYRFGASNVTVGNSGAIRINHASDELEEHVLVIDTILKGHRLKRQIIPRAKVTEVGEEVYKDSELIGYQVTVTALPYTGGNGATSYEFIEEAGA